MKPVEHDPGGSYAGESNWGRDLAKKLVGFGKMRIPKMLGKLSGGVGWRLRQLYDQALYRLTFIHRRSLSNTVFIGVTGSAGKTTTKDLIASVLERSFSKGRKNPGSLNWPEDMVRMVLSTRQSDAFCIAEISAHRPGAMDLPLALVRPKVGVVTNIGSDHISAYKNRDAIADEKGKLIRSLPSGGVAILNADDPRVLAMRSLFAGRTVTYGLSSDAQLHGEAIHSAWPKRLSLTATWHDESVQVTTQLCGVHWAPAVLAALATGVALGVPLRVAAQAVADVPAFEGRMAPVEVDGITFIRDDWKAPLSTIEPAFEFMRSAQAKRRVVVLGTISDYQGDSTRRYVEIGESALAFADCVVFVGPRASASLRAKRDGNAEFRAFASLRDASTYLRAYLKAGDLVLLKGSHKADHIQRLIIQLKTEVQCWRSDCGRLQSCETCELLHVPSGPQATDAVLISSFASAELAQAAEAVTGLHPSTVVLVGLGNPEAGRFDTPHNVGYRALDSLAQRMAQPWHRDADLALVVQCRWQGATILMIKPLAPMNEIGPVLIKLAKKLAFEVRQCILVHDDLDLPIGSVRARLRGGDGGHRGVRSILQSFQDDKFRRVKIGVGQPEAGQSVIDYVLTPFPATQHAAVEAANRTAVDRIVELIRQGVTAP
ncbi:MAG: aminoacyl-tRNA hydrolase [Gammaproteobacteria bacterium]|uniref:aminoacyl-tRNA hydrolase n=1 Tax=Rhodoferax sp. TaxID=50421 RepID=UPI0017C2B73C|nr:aminoacyl-tRNA hydrolase [Rhodoferax sp.]MBU3897510.1 aminoacyl-tRNA hydrolase [Gammaproteobacteria bacterium]MBA3058018.1 aminoacyl-tRNA hydrolase [Rhodoferax sp.]MBU3998819.1 aminoacyl-tRNA hydrolase [Gammaproteobacteria bacterium]MBU4018856.1 aminoacyl-tRNA hydrolase [Gammaproteobacteria bacterium]MBU4079811.1 aminoacyl-tRNA hydrolase [Gammaproteobacteria bacterium]